MKPPRVFLPAVASGLLLWVAFFPLNLGPVAFVALAPWLTLVRAPVSRRRRYFAAYLGSVAFFLPAVQWMRVAHPAMYASWLGLALIMCPMYWVVGFALLRRLDRVPGVPLAASFPVVWVALEYVRAHAPTGFDFLPAAVHQKVGVGWYFLGYSQHDFLPLIQLADLGGVYAVSAVVAAVNGVAAEWLMSGRLPLGRGASPVGPEALTGLAPRPNEPTGLRKLIASTLGTAVVFAAAVGYGLVRLNHPAFENGPVVAAVQGSVPQFQKNTDGRSLGQVYAALHLRAALANPTPDLILWPETCFPAEWLAATGPPPADFAAQIAACRAYFAREQWRVPVLLGLGCTEYDAGDLWKYNSALLLTAAGQEVGRYDKIHLVPFGEYVPFRGTFPWLQAFTPYEGDYSCRPGQRWTRFPVTGADGRRFTFGCLICYEDSDPSLARRYALPAGDEPAVNFLVNLSNDGWFDGTEEHELHLAVCRFRAVECRRSVVRAVNMGISAVIDPDGRVVTALPKQVEGVVSAAVPIDGRESLYARLGDWLPGACWAAILVGVVVGRRRPPGASAPR
ncbi:apolipoprotein N-acyltransferase [Urbifossiella limnaea]|uniref:Apolipoprotein N-acyltransferase n=1 Tax=Urbifossiella limnaea TaxID=2528023 RepID=A0A517XNW2_9BACT|nr:apolipoprotein N-acyltransferase [Urbifossiella limnaea]QDU19197.1 Apolipoprotein N-acyltransferase [Urbifossiella limnaea]